LQKVDIDEVSNLFNISFKNKLQYKLLVIFYLFVFQESIEESEFVYLSTSYDQIFVFLNIYVNTRGYPWIPANMKKIDGYPHNRYPTDMDTGTGQIFIQRIGYGGGTTRILPIPLTSLPVTYHKKLFLSLN